MRPTDGVWFVVIRPSATLGAHLYAVSMALWRLLTGVHAQFVLVCRVCGHLASVYRCAPSVSCVCGVLDNLAPVHGCARWGCCVPCAVSLATWLLFTGVHAHVLCVQCCWLLCSC